MGTLQEGGRHPYHSQGPSCCGEGVDRERRAVIAWFAAALIIIIILAPTFLFWLPLPFEYDEVRPFLCWASIASGITIVAYLLYASLMNKDPTDPGSW